MAGGHLGLTGLNREPLTQFREQNRTGKSWKRGQDMEQKYRSLSQDCRDENRQAQPRLELELVKGMSGNKGISTATLAAEGRLLLTGNTVMKDTEKTKDSVLALSQPFWQSVLSGLPGLCIRAPAWPPVLLR